MEKTDVKQTKISSSTSDQGKVTGVTKLTRDLMWDCQERPLTFKMKPKIMRRGPHTVWLGQQTTRALRQQKLCQQHLAKGLAYSKCPHKVAIVIEKNGFICSHERQTDGRPNS